MTQYVVIYFPHGLTKWTEANGPYRSQERAEREVERLVALEDRFDIDPSLMPSVVALGEPSDYELTYGFRLALEEGGDR